MGLFVFLGRCGMIFVLEDVWIKIEKEKTEIIMVILKDSNKDFMGN